MAGDGTDGIRAMLFLDDLKRAEHRLAQLMSGALDTRRPTATMME